MRIAIHQRDYSFSTDWIDYCIENKIDYKIVNAYDSNIIEQLKDCDIFLWHFNHTCIADKIFAKQLMYSLEISGKKIFPDYRTCWFFDDKIGQKYLLESIGAPIAKTYIFYDKQNARNWAKKVSYPIIFKLSTGAGSSNVLLIENYRQAKSLINKSFNNGFSQVSNWRAFKERSRLFFQGQKNFLTLIKGFKILLLGTSFSNKYVKEKNYALFQNFMQNNNFDIRIIVIDNKAFGIKRMNRKNDFRASASGTIIYNRNEINIKCVEVAFKINDRINTQCIAFDFVFDSNSNPVIIEISFGFDPRAYEKCEGYWQRDLEWIDKKFNPSKWIINSLINK